MPAEVVYWTQALRNTSQAGGLVGAKSIDEFTETADLQSAVFFLIQPDENTPFIRGSDDGFQRIGC